MQKILNYTSIWIMILKRKRIKPRNIRNLIDSEYIHHSTVVLSDSFIHHGFKKYANFLYVIQHSKKDDEEILSNIDYLIRRVIEKHPEYKSKFKTGTATFYKWCEVNKYAIEEINQFTIKRKSWFSVCFYAALSVILFFVGMVIFVERAPSIPYHLQNITYVFRDGTRLIIPSLIGMITLPLFVHRKIKIDRMYKWARKDV